MSLALTGTPASVAGAARRHRPPQDAFLNTVTGYTGTVHFTTTSGSATLRLTTRSPAPTTAPTFGDAGDRARRRLPRSTP